MGGQTQKTVLVVEDDTLELASAAEALQAAGFRVACAQDATTAATVCRNWRPDMAVLDFSMPGGTGLDVFRQVRIICGSLLPVLFVTGSPERIDPSVLRLPAVRMLTKPVRPMVLADAARAMLGI